MLAAALGLLQYVPDLVDAFSGKKEEMAPKLLNTARQAYSSVTGSPTLDLTDEEIISGINTTSSMQVEFKKLVMEDKYFMAELALANTNAARDMYKETAHRTADKIANKIMSENLWFVCGLFIVQVGAMYFFKDEGTILGLLGNAVGYITNSLLKERQDVSNFFYGSSLGSKMKKDK